MLKWNMKIPSKIKACAAIMAAMLLCVADCHAQKPKQERVDPAELSFGENVANPKPAAKGLRDLQDHMKALEASFVKHGLKVGSERGGEVVVVTVPCDKLFKPNEAVIKASGQKYLRPFADFLKYPTMYKLIVAVYSDDTGEAEYSEALTSERANAIDAFLEKEAAMPGKNVVPYGMGQDDPEVPNTSYAGRAANRRVEIYIVPEWQMLEMAKSGKLKQK